MRVERKQQNGLSGLTAAIVMVDCLDASVVGEEKIVVDPIDRWDQAWLAGPHRCEEGLSVPACGANRSVRLPRAMHEVNRPCLTVEGTTANMNKMSQPRNRICRWERRRTDPQTPCRC